MNQVLYIDKSTLFAGAEASLLTLLRELDRSQFRPAVVADYPMAHHDRLGSSSAAILYRSRAAKWWTGFDRWRRPPRGVHVLKRLVQAAGLANIIRATRARIVHVNLLRTNSYLDLLVSRRCGARTVGHVRALMSQSPIACRTLQLCDIVLCTSDRVRQDILELHTGKKLPELIKVHDPIDSVRWAGDRASAARALGLPDNVRYVCSVAILDPRKGHDVAIEAFAVAAPKLPHVRLLIVGGFLPGGESEMFRLRDLSSQLGIADRVRFLGHVGDISPVYAVSDLIYALSSDGEALGRVPLEAAAAGRVTIATAAGATPELLRHDETGLLVRPRDPAAVAQWTREIFCTPERFAAMAKAAAADVRVRFMPRRHVITIERAYRQILSHRREATCASGRKLSAATAGASSS